MGLGIIPFDALNLRLRAVKMDGKSVVDNRLDPATWPLVTRLYLGPQNDRGRTVLERVAGSSAQTNRDPARLSVLVMTGVTAMARNSAVAIEKAGDDGFLARNVGPELAAADLTIISNEIPFIEGCVPNNTLNNLFLCSKPEYFLNLDLSGTDAIGLTGNHQNDFGYDNMRSSLAFYQSKQLPVYGGGIDNASALAPLRMEHHGNRLVFLGANQYGPEVYTIPSGERVSAWAGADHPGSAQFDRATMSTDIVAARELGDLVLAEVQHTEFNAAGDYQVNPIPSQVADFRALSDAGADIVTGIQSHVPQALEIRNGKLILYGLGNLYFDQTWSWPTRTGLVARHTLYGGKHINTELLVTVIDKNFQLRWATPEERIQTLKSVFAASEW
jgi:poly-gamma-glutamate synthesis protein (capsule biosynthesis protein)